MTRAVLALLWCCVAGAAGAATTTPDLTNVLPPVVKDTTKAATCTVTYLVADIATNDLYAVRMRIDPDPNDVAVGDLMPCPKDIPVRVAARALDACIRRAGSPKDCVFADMSREFQRQPKVDNTAENFARCASDKAADIGVACWRSGALEICDVGCGASPAAATAAAVTRCEAKQQHQCPITGALPVLAPR